MQLTKAEYEKIAKHWELKAYQRWPRLNVRLKYFSQFVPLFEGKDVLEIGCNAGMYMWEIAHSARSVTGVDLSDRYMAQAQITKKYIEKFNPNVEFNKMSVKDFCREIRKGQRDANINALFASFAMYHLSDKELDAVAEYILPKCDIVIIQNRTKKRTNRKKKKGWRTHNLRHFEKNSTVIEWLEASGFECEVHWGPEKKFSDVIGRRKDAPTGDAGGDSEGEGEAASGRDTPIKRQRRVDKGSTQPTVGKTRRKQTSRAKGDDGSVLPLQAGQGSEGVRPTPGVQDIQQEGPDEGLEKQGQDGSGGDNPQGDEDN